MGVSNPGQWFEKRQGPIERENPLSAGGTRSCWRDGNRVSVGQVRLLASALLQGSQGGCVPLDLCDDTEFVTLGDRDRGVTVLTVERDFHRK